MVRRPPSRPSRKPPSAGPAADWPARAGQIHPTRRLSHRHDRAPPPRLGDARLVLLVSWWFTSATERKKTTKTPRTPRRRANPPGLLPMARPLEPVNHLRATSASRRRRCPRRRIGLLARAESTRHVVSHRHDRAPPVRSSVARSVVFVSLW